MLFEIATKNQLPFPFVFQNVILRMLKYEEPDDFTKNLGKKLKKERNCKKYPEIVECFID